MSGRLPAAPALIARATTTAPRARIDGAASDLTSLADRIAGLSRGLNRSADEAAANRAAEAGALAGDAQPGAQMVGGGELVRTAYNTAAAEAASRRLEVQARARVAELAQQHQEDPVAFSTAVAAWRDGLAGQMPPAIAQRLRLQVDALAVPALGALRTQAERRVQDEARGSFLAALPGRIADIEQAAQRTTTDPTASTSLEAATQALRTDLARLGPRAAFTLDGVEYPADPTRTGALSITQMQEQINRVRQSEQDAMALGAWRAAGGGRAWIDDFERGQTSGRSLVERIFRAENAAGDNRRNAMGSSATGPGQITQGTWDQWAPRLGLTDAQRNDRAAHVAIFNAYQQDAQARIGRPLTDGEAYAAWMLGTAGLQAFLRAEPNADAQTVYAAAAGNTRAAQAFSQNPRILEPGMTVSQVLTAIDRRVPPDPQGRILPLADTRRIADRLRAELARDETARREAEREAIVQLTPLMQANAASLATAGRGLHEITDDQLRAAGYDSARIARHRDQERAAAAGWQARTDLQTASTPEELAALASRFAPGTDLFAADPQGASRILELARQRGAQVGNAALEERVADLRAQAEATGAVPPILTAEEGAAAGLRPEQLARLNDDLRLAAARGQLRRDAPRMSPEDQARFRRDTPIEGDSAAENRERLRIFEAAIRDQVQGLAADPAGYALAISPAAQGLAQQLQAGLANGDVSAMGPLVALLAAEQRRLGVPTERQRALPQPMLDAMAETAANARDPASAMAGLATLATATGLPRLRDALASIQGPAASTRREAMAVAAAVQGRDPGLARSILAGTAFLRDNPMPGVTPQLAEDAADRVLGNAYRAVPRARSELIAAATAIYAAEAASQGKTAGAFDASRFRAALERVQPMARWDGQTLPLPTGMTARQLTERLSNLPAEALAGAVAQDGRAITPAMVARGGFELVPVGSGLFELRFGGRQVIDARAGSAFRLDINAAGGPAQPLQMRGTSRNDEFGLNDE